MQVLGPPVAGGLSIYLEEQNILISKDGGAPGEPKWKAFATFPSLYSSYLILLPPNNPLFIKPSTKHSGLTISSGLPLPLKAPVKVIFVIFFFSLIFLLLIKSNSPAGESRREGEKDFFFPPLHVYKGFPGSSAGEESQFNSWVRKICRRRDRLPTPVFLGFASGSDGKEPACNTEDLGLIPGLGRFPGEGNSYPLQYSGLENPMDCIVHGVTKSQTRLSDFHFHTYINRVDDVA